MNLSELGGYQMSSTFKKENIKLCTKITNFQVNETRKKII